MTAQLSTPLGKIQVPCEFKRLQIALLNLGQSMAQDGVILTDDAFRAADVAMSPFFVMVTPEFRVLLQAETSGDGALSETSVLTFEPDAIAAVLKKMRCAAIKTRVRR